ncbi:hypothetical protein N9051_02565 [Akkermansiaceae bacterium]|nr:hypothetical protein [Akkermansiaceae bacterium]
MTLRLILALCLCLDIQLSAQQNWLGVPNPTPEPINQLRMSGNACGPASLLDAFQCGSEKWQFSAAQITGRTQKQRMMKIILDYGRKPSAQFPKQQRWQPRAGISGVDLGNMANEMRKKYWMGTVKQQLFFKATKKSDLSHLHHSHKTLSKSLNKGLPPIMSVRRMAFRAPRSSNQKCWLTVKRHFLVLTGLPKKLAKNATSFPVTYRDPWGGHEYRGTIRIPTATEAPISTSILDLPRSKIGKELIKRGETESLSLSSAIGVF